jgi:hypothetical protein
MCQVGTAQGGVALWVVVYVWFLIAPGNVKLKFNTVMCVGVRMGYR